MLSVALIVVNFNNNKDTVEFLKSLRHIEKYNRIAFKVFLVDNGSGCPLTRDEVLISKLPISYFTLKENLGFTGGNNFAIREARKEGFDYYAMINNDTVIEDDSFIRLVDAMEIQAEIGIGGIVNYFHSNPLKIWQAGSILNKVFFRYKSITRVDADNNTLQIVEHVPGSSMFIKSQVVESIGLLDDQYFAYYEEADYCMRAMRAGYKIAYLPSSRILHKVGKSTTSHTKQYLRDRNHLYFCSLYGNNAQMVMVYMQVVILALLHFLTSGLDTRYLKMLRCSIQDYWKGNLGKGILK